LPFCLNKARLLACGEKETKKLTDTGNEGTLSGEYMIIEKLVRYIFQNLKKHTHTHKINISKINI